MNSKSKHGCKSEYWNFFGGCVGGCMGLIFFLLAYHIMYAILSKLIIKDQTPIKFTHIYSEYNFLSNSTKRGFVKLNQKLSKDEFLSYVDQRGRYILVSNLFSKKYECTGKCICNKEIDPSERRARKLGFAGKLLKTVKWTSIIVTAVASVYAVKVAIDFFNKYCDAMNEKYANCPPPWSVAEVERCQEVDEKKEREMYLQKQKKIDMDRERKLKVEMEKEKERFEKLQEEERIKRAKRAEREERESIEEEKKRSKRYKQEEGKDKIGFPETREHYEKKRYNYFDCSGKCGTRRFVKHLVDMKTCGNMYLEGRVKARSATHAKDMFGGVNLTPFCNNVEMIEVPDGSVFSVCDIDVLSLNCVQIKW